MGIRGELYSTRVSCEGRTYFFNVKENRMGDLFLTIVESKPTEAETFDRRSVVIFRDDVPAFLKAFQGALGFLAKSGQVPPTLNYSPEANEASENRQRRAHAGFAGAPEVPVKKRKVVVKRKPASDEDAPSA